MALHLLHEPRPRTRQRGGRHPASGL